MNSLEPKDHFFLLMLSPVFVNLRNIAKDDEDRLERALKIIAMMLKNLDSFAGKEEDLIDILTQYMNFNYYEALKIIDYLNSNKITFTEEDFKDPIVYDYFRTIDKDKD